MKKLITSMIKTFAVATIGFLWGVWLTQSKEGD